MSVRNRVKALEAWASAQHPPEGGPDDTRRDRAELLRHVPPDLREAVGAALDADEGTADSLTPWLVQPFAPWAGAARTDYQLPRHLVAWLIDPPRRYWFGYACECCGLRVPTYFTWTADPDAPPSVVAFPACPACGGRTSSGGHYKQNEGEQCD